jgi:general secretion pathway protein N
MKRATLSLVFATAFAGALAVTLPMAFVLSWLGADKMGLSAAEVSGSIWDGHLRAAQYRNVSLGDVQTSLDPFALFVGTRRLAVQGTFGRATLAQGDTFGFETAAATTIALEHLRPSLPLSGRLRLENATLLFSRDRCVRAGGRIVIDVLERSLSAPEVSGTLSCAGQAATAQLEGRTQDIQVNIALRLDATGRYQAETRIVSANPTVRDALALAGFAENGGGFTRSDEGELGK